MAHETPLSVIAFQKTDGSTGELSIHDIEAIHDVEGSVNTTNLANGAVHTEDISSQAVTSDKLANNAVNTINVVDHAITKNKLSTDITEEWDSASFDIDSMKTTLDGAIKYAGSVQGIGLDWNTIVNPGMYIANGRSQLDGHKNAPYTTSDGILVVYRASVYIIQEFKTGSNIAERASRNSGASWSEWKRIALS